MLRSMPLIKTLLNWKLTVAKREQLRCRLNNKNGAKMLMRSGIYMIFVIPLFTGRDPIGDTALLKCGRIVEICQLLTMFLLCSVDRPYKGGGPSYLKSDVYFGFDAV